MIYLDLFLISRVESFSNKKNADITKRMVDSYRKNYAFAIESGSDLDIILFKHSQAELRKFIEDNRKK